MSTISAGTTSTTTLVHSGDTTGSLVFKTNDTGSGGTTAMTIDTSQNVGIGTTTMNGLLNLYGGDFYMQNSTTGTASNDGLRIYLDTSESNSANFRLYESAAMKFFTVNAERMRIDSSGNLLVGVTSAVSAGSTGLTLYKAGEIDIASAGTSLTTAMSFINNNGAVGTIKTTGSSTQFNTSSDVRLKKNIVDAPSAIASIQQIGIRSFDWKADDLHQDYGVIAQELDAVAPEAVSHGATEDEMWGVDYSKLVPRMIKAIQELKAINDQQAETINALTARVVALEQK